MGVDLEPGRDRHRVSGSKLEWADQLCEGLRWACLGCRAGNERRRARGGLAGGAREVSFCVGGTEELGGAGSPVRGGYFVCDRGRDHGGERGRWRAREGVI